MYSNDDFNMIPPLFNEYWRYRRNIRPLEEQVEVVTLPDDKLNTGNHAVERVDRVTNSPPVGPTNKTCKAIGVDVGLFDSFEYFTFIALSQLQFKLISYSAPKAQSVVRCAVIHIYIDVSPEVPKNCMLIRIIYMYLNIINKNT